MKRRNALSLIGGIAGAGTGVLKSGIGIASAQNYPRENSRWHTHADVMDRLATYEHTSQGAVSLETIGDSIEGRELVVATVGDGDTDVFVTSEQHGDEPTGTVALLKVLQRLAAGGNAVAPVRDELTVHALPMHNPDGGMRNQRTNADGIDPNRQHDYEPGATDNPSPETQAMIDYVTALEPTWVADLHTQTGDYVDDDGESISASTFWPIAPAAQADAVERSKRMNWAMYDEVDDEYGFANMSQYPGGTGANIARNAYGIRGYGSALLEMTGQVDDRGQRMEGKMVRHMRAQIETLLAETADGSLFARDPDLANTIPERGSSSPWPWDSE
ncbi:M14 family zinc carboxypeptidase [Natrialba asiatica]|uniref:Peptidase M14 carboxypeptidase A n=1 Tax=Natrialba asiatica (strain ATCC 700177 / DSM 12278 / JCM 9576 / FERM P-10747 / NBRC 102637 / 172P1) TaxID=29540 RepID=M0AS95_NATA1|nr:M14 family zinc carboxypeptidase [Natrialba asiatica]ELZ00823.1 peptidase M14 carboxypeptidase A [Natrialba asiatica DSM 12278]